ncbi:MAG TPA: histidine kinase dimerization/phospho-acceptor domain-containing protein [Gemmatimonadaceae bacterium]|nr:histidine kinase dimerization/phospho-acceptor domain-containing protein [Gemmatimonadaceae bacterium]
MRSRSSPRRTTRTPANSASPTAARWLECFQQLAGRVAHGIKNPLNGAMLNAEVMRQRVRRPDVQAAELAPFADAAATELARAAELFDALLRLARPASLPVDLAVEIQALATLYGAIASEHGGAVVVERRGDGTFETTVDPSDARYLLAQLLEAAVSGASVHMTLSGGAEGVAVAVHGAATDAALPPLAYEVAAGHRIALSTLPDGITMLFPRSARGGMDGTP